MSAEVRFARVQHVLADVLTCCNLAAGTAATLIPGANHTACRASLVLLGAACDTIDGPLARHSGNPTDFGAAADSISDVITCGVAPAAILAHTGVGREARWMRAVPGVYLAASAWRLARFGIGPRTSHVFRGVPVTGAGVLFAFACHARLSPRALSHLALVLSIAMVSPIRVLSGEALVRRDLTSLDIPVGPLAKS